MALPLALASIGSSASNAVSSIAQLIPVLLKFLLISSFIALTIGYLPDIIKLFSYLYSIFKYTFSLFYYIGASSTSITVGSTIVLSSLFFFLFLYLFKLLFK